MNNILKRFSNKLFLLFLVNFILIVFQLVYLSARFEYINTEVPFWCTQVWGLVQLANKGYLYILPTISFFILLAGCLFCILLRKYYIKYGLDIIIGVVTTTNLLLSYSLLEIIFNASKPFPYIIKPLYLTMLAPGVISYLVSFYIIPRFIKFAQEKNIVTNPNIHSHPGMVLQKPSARGGGFLFGILFVLFGIIFLGFTPWLIPFFLAVVLLALLGIIDDYQNTRPASTFKIIENPLLRLLLMIVVVSIIYVSGINIGSFTIPFGVGVLKINLEVVSWALTTIWIVWVLNVMSWSNGIDGQYAGIVGIGSIVICLLALRFDPLEAQHKTVAILAAISAGLSFSFTKYTWHPSKIMWGFGATSAGLVLSVLSILVSSKIITSVLIIMIPFLDAVITVIRRLVQGKNPLKGDRGHLHHLLLNRGWSIRKIASFYWVTTAMFGMLGFLTADKLTIQVGLILVGIVAFLIILTNVRLNKATQ